MGATRHFVRATIRAAGFDVTGTYHGGAYIDLSFGPNGPAFDVINVWDYAADRPTIHADLSTSYRRAKTREAVKAELREWRKAAGDSLAHDLREYALSIR